MSSSLIKAAYTNIGKKDEKRVIDSNQAISDRLKKLNEILESNIEYSGGVPDEFEEGLQAEQIDALFSDSDEGVYAEPQPSFAQEDIDNIINEANAQAQQIIDSANSEAENIISNARAQAEQIQSDAFAQGMQQGEERGYQEGLANVTQMENELNEQIQAVNAEYEAAIAEIEPQFIELLTGIYEHIFSVDLTDKQEIVLHLLNNAIRNIDGSSNFFVHVSKEDYDFVNDNKEVLTRGLASTCIVEIIEDISLAAGGCFIEAESGIFDCSIDTELSNLRKELALLSYRN